MICLVNTKDGNNNNDNITNNNKKEKVCVRYRELNKAFLDNLIFVHLNGHVLSFQNLISFLNLYN